MDPRQKLTFDPTPTHYSADLWLRLMADHPDLFPDKDDLELYGAAAPAPDVDRLLADYQLASRIAAAEADGHTLQYAV